MVATCSAHGCTNRQKAGGNIRFHRFPFISPDLLNKWVIALGRNDDFIPKVSSRLCSAHFIKSDYYIQGTILKPDAVPSIFPALKSSKKETKGAKKRLSATTEDASYQPRKGSEPLQEHHNASNTSEIHSSDSESKLTINSRVQTSETKLKVLRKRSEPLQRQHYESKFQRHFSDADSETNFTNDSFFQTNETKPKVPRKGCEPLQHHNNGSTFGMYFSDSDCEANFSKDACVQTRVTEVHVNKKARTIKTLRQKVKRQQRKIKALKELLKDEDCYLIQILRS